MSTETYPQMNFWQECRKTVCPKMRREASHLITSHTGAHYTAQLLFQFIADLRRVACKLHLNLLNRPCRNASCNSLGLYWFLEATVKKCVFIEDGFKCLRESIFSVFYSWICFCVNNIHWSSGNHILGEYVFPTQHLNSCPYMNQRICLGEDRFVYSF